MHHLVVKSNLSDSDSNKLKKLSYGGGGSSTNDQDQPLCPKPRRLVGPSIPDFLKPLRCLNHSQLSTDARSGILNLIHDKNVVERRDCICSDGCSASASPPPACYSGSPPGRTDNPLVHDVQFTQYQVELVSPLTTTTRTQAL